MTCCVFGFFPRAYGHLLMQNSHLTVLRQATQLSLAQSESAKALQSHTADNVGVSLLLFQYEDCKKNFRPFRTPCIIFVMPPLPVGGPQPSAAGRRGLPGCGEKELDVKIHYVFSKEIELVKKQIKYTAILKEYAFYLRNSARLP